MKNKMYFMKFLRKIWLTLGIVSILGISCSQSNSTNKYGRTWVVNNGVSTAKDNNVGSEKRPLKTIQAAADKAMPGDTILVREGIYREYVIPPRGGESRVRPIVYLAAPGKEVSIRGSEQITSWQDMGAGIWMVELDISFFKDYNPFALPVSGEWLSKMSSNGVRRYHRLGEVYNNGEAFSQKMSIEEMKNMPNTWFTDLNYGYLNKTDYPDNRKYPDNKIQILANFGDVNPNISMSEINTRACAIFPEKQGLNYIVIDGFDIRHTAPQWADIYTTEYGAIGTRFGYGWTIQNCRISYSRNVAICLGVTDEIHFPREDEGGLLEGGGNIPPLNKVGHHLIRNNRISRCGQAGIYGCYGGVGCIIEGNVITDINYRDEWRGSNQAAVKILFPIDAIIRDNFCIAAHGIETRAKGIWLDWGSQNTRVTGNLIYGFGNLIEGGFFSEVNFGPIMVDNNIFVQSYIKCESNGCIFAHNFFSDCIFRFWFDPERIIPYFKPHSSERIGKTSVSLLHNHIYNNIVVGGEGLARNDVIRDKKGVNGFTIDGNIFLNGAGPFPGKDEHSIKIDDQIEMILQVDECKADLDMKLPEEIFTGKYQIVTSEMIGKIPIVEMKIEHSDGRPLDITTDYFGKKIDSTSVLPGPFQQIKKGNNNFRLWPK